MREIKFQHHFKRYQKKISDWWVGLPQREKAKIWWANSSHREKVKVWWTNLPQREKVRIWWHNLSLREKIKNAWLNSPQREKAKEWWSTLAPREKQAVTIGGSLLGLFILYQFIWSPYLDHIADLRNNIAAKQKSLLWIQAANKEIHNIETKNPTQTTAISPVTLLGYLQDQVQSSGMAPNMTQLKQSSNDSIDIHFQKVEFDQLIKFLTKVCKEQRVSIAQMSATAEGTPGVVSADIILKLI